MVSRSSALDALLRAAESARTIGVARCLRALLRLLFGRFYAPEEARARRRSWHLCLFP